LLGVPTASKQDEGKGNSCDDVLPAHPKYSTTAS
jgi:hypothetical protein